MADWFTRAFGSAVADARAALIDEAWFGRRGSSADHSLGFPQESRHAADTERDPLGRAGEPEREPERGFERESGQGFEIDR